MKRTIISSLFTFFAFVSLYSYDFFVSTAKTAVNDLLKEGFVEIHIFPYKKAKALHPQIFMDKYTFIEVDDQNIVLTNIITGNKSIILESDWLDYECGITVHSLINSEMYFSTKNGQEFNIYKYNLKDKELEFIRHISLENKKSITFFYLDEEMMFVYIEQGYDCNVYCYDLYSDSPYIKKQHYKRPYYEGRYPFAIFSPATGEKEVHCITKYNDFFYPNENVIINDVEYLVVNRCKRLVSELCIINIETDTSRLFCLKDFGYEITGLYQVNDDEYCFIVKCQDNSRIFCYFTKDMLESK